MNAGTLVTVTVVVSMCGYVHTTVTRLLVLVRGKHAQNSPMEDAKCDVVTRGCWEWRSSALRWEMGAFEDFLDRTSGTAPDGRWREESIIGRFRVVAVWTGPALGRGLIAALLWVCYLLPCDLCRCTAGLHAVHNAYTDEKS